MNTYLFIKHTVLVSSLMLGLWLLPGLTGAADKPSGQVIPSGSDKEMGKISAGSAKDTLKACMARIPKDASAGQHMLAEQTCEREEKARKESGAALTF